MYAECGGLMYLCDRLYGGQGSGVNKDAEEQGDKHKKNTKSAVSACHSMVGVLPFDVTMTPRMAMGYCTARPSPTLSALLHLSPLTELKGHQYHFSEVTVEGEPAERLSEDGVGKWIDG